MRVLAISPHTDDAELGCGGYLNKLHEEKNEITSVTFSFYAHGKNLMDEWVGAVSMVSTDYRMFDYPVRQFDRSRQSILEVMITLRDEYDPELVLIPSSSDIHQDHSVIYSEAIRAFSKECCVLSYELPWNTRAFRPNYFVELSEAHLDGKHRMLECYRSQSARPYFDRRFTEGIARTRGQQVRKEFVEAFEVVTWIS